MPDTAQALVVLIVAILPGALHTWAFEREAGNWGVGLADRVLRFAGATAIYQVAFAFPLYQLWARVLHQPVMANGSKGFRNLILEAAPLPWWTWLVPVAYVGIPLAVGTFAGRSVHRRPRIARILAGKDPAPRAWDHLFSPGPSGVIRVRLKDDTWIGGLFGRRSYAAGYPEPQDLYLESAYRVLADGQFAQGPTPSEFVELGSGILVRWDEVKFLEFFPLEVDGG